MVILVGFKLSQPVFFTLKINTKYFCDLVSTFVTDADSLYVSTLMSLTGCLDSRLLMTFQHDVVVV